MPEHIFIADASLVREPDDDFFAEDLPSVHCHGIFQEARAQLYSLLMGVFLEDALQYEALIHEGDGDGALVYELAPHLVTTLAEQVEDDIDRLVRQWQETQEIQEVNAVDTDLSEFLFSFINLCQISRNDEELGVFVLSDG